MDTKSFIATFVVCATALTISSLFSRAGTGAAAPAASTQPPQQAIELGLTTCPCPGDANCDGAVNFDDITAVLANFGSRCCPVAYVSLCDDGNACTIDACDAVTGTCTHTPGTGTECNDNNPCTIDSCDPITGACVFTLVPGTPCDDGIPCTTNDVCVNGICRGTPKDCNDGNPCTVDVCDPVTGECVSTIPPGNACDDGDPCTENDVCVNGVCRGTRRICNDGNPCTVDSCNPVTGACTFTIVPGSPCDDGNPCTVNDTCANGVCVGFPRNCDDGDPCTADSCDPFTGACVHTFVGGGPCPR